MSEEADRDLRPGWSFECVLPTCRISVPSQLNFMIIMACSAMHIFAAVRSGEECNNAYLDSVSAQLGMASSYSEWCMTADFVSLARL